MKISRWFRHAGFINYLRISLAVTLLAAGAAIAIVGTRPDEKKTALFRLRGDPDRDMDRDRITRPGPDEEGPWARALEQYRLRAYPAADYSFDLTQKAIHSWSRLQLRFDDAMALNPVNPFLNWKLIGPSIATFPAPLAFSGASYVTSGRVEGFALAPGCNTTACRLWVAAAGGGIWRTDNALATTPTWTFLSQSFATNSIGTLVYDAPNNTLYAGTGEATASSDSMAGLGIYKSTDGGNNWTLLASTIGPITTTSPGTGSNGTYTGNAFAGRGISSILIDPTNANHMFVSTVRDVRGVSATGAGTTSNPSTPRPPFGLFESTDGGATFSFRWDGGDACPATCDGTTAKATVRGVHQVALDPGWNGTSNKIIYGSAYGSTATAGSGGIWRSIDGGLNWTQIHTARALNNTVDTASFAVTTIAGPKTRMYVGIGNDGNTAATQAHLFRTDDAVAATGDASFTDLTALQDASAAPNQTTGYCSSSAGGQCWYDNVVYSPPGKPDVVYLGGSYDYDQYSTRNNGRSFLRSTDAGVTFTDMTWSAEFGPQSNPPADSLTFSQPGMHPDSHVVVEVPGTNIAIYGSDGGVVRTDGTFTDTSNTCTDPNRTPGGLTGADLATCQQLLKAIPTKLISMNVGLSTLQFQSVSVSSTDNTNVQGGTQDNGTFQTFNSQSWPQWYFGDGGLSGFSSTNPALRFASNTGRSMVANFHNGDPTQSVLIYNGVEGSALFYAPKIADPSPLAPQTIFHGGTSVWRTQDWGGNQAALEANCNIFTATTLAGCGDFVAIGPVGATAITGSNAADYRGTTRSGGNVSWLARTAADTGTLWAATSAGRLFISKNADAVPQTTVTYTRVDSLDATSPTRAITSIYVDPTNPNHAWVAYNGYAFNTPTTPGHIYSVVFNPVGPTATFTNLDGSGAGVFPDFPATSIVAAPNGDLYAANDFGVLRLPNGAVDWEISGANLPMVEICSLRISPDSKKLFAATHGRSVWVADLPNSALTTPTLTTQANPASTTLGGSVRDTATLAGGVAPTGSITFQLFNNSTCSGSPVFTSNVTINDNGSYDSATYTPTQIGTYYWVATYNGDANNNFVRNSCGDPAETVTVTAVASPTPTATATATPVATATATATSTPTATATSTPTATATSTATATATATATSTPTATATPTAAPASQALNLSTRMRTDSGNNVAIGGFTITGAVPKHVLIRALGPSLTKFGFSAAEVLTDPTLEVHGPGAFGTITNNNWRDSQEAQIKADGLAPTNDLESAIDATLPPGAYTAIIRANTGTPVAGICTFEVYDLDVAAASKLGNLSTRAFVGTGNNVVIAGFVLGNNQGDDRIVVRGLGPSLAAFGIANTLADPTLELRNENGVLLVSDNDWQDDPAQATELTTDGLAPSDPKESAIAATLPPGLYTAILAGANNGTGVGTVEVYDLGP